jgi:hypothetical protein
MDKWYKDVPELIKRTDNLYQRIVEKGGRDKLAATRDRMVQERGWEPCLNLFQDNFDDILKELSCFYVPKLMAPGPMFCFPLFGVDGHIRMQSKPLEGSVEFGRGKYLWFGDEGIGPTWLGNSDRMIQKVIESRTAAIVEGPFDLLACRLIEPNAPVLCPLTKRIGNNHQIYLKMLGVKTVFGFFDNDKQGNIGIKSLQKEMTELNIEELVCPAQDQSKCLQDRSKAMKLRNILRSIA